MQEDVEETVKCAVLSYACCLKSTSSVVQLLDAFAKLRKATISFVIYAGFSFRLSAWNNSAPSKGTFRIFGT